MLYPFFRGFSPEWGLKIEYASHSGVFGCAVTVDFPLRSTASNTLRASSAGTNFMIMNSAALVTKRAVALCAIIAGSLSAASAPAQSVQHLNTTQWGGMPGLPT